MPKKDLPRYHNLQSYFGDFSHLWYAVHIIVITACQQLSQLCFFYFLVMQRNIIQNSTIQVEHFYLEFPLDARYLVYWPKDY